MAVRRLFARCHRLLAWASWMDGKLCLALRVNNLRGSWDALLTVCFWVFQSISAGFCAFERVEPHHMMQVQVFFQALVVCQGEISNHFCGGNFSFKHSKAHDVHAESLDWCPPWLWERVSRGPKLSNFVGMKQHIKCSGVILQLTDFSIWHLCNSPIITLPLVTRMLVFVN